MIEKLDFLVRFWELTARNASLGEPLSSREQMELLSLMQLVTSGLDVPQPGPVERPKGALPAQVIGEGAFLPVEIRAVGPSALVVSSAVVLPKGAQVIVRAADAVSGVEYALPCKVLWIHAASPAIIALAVDGIPTRRVFVEVPEPRLSTPLMLSIGPRKHARLIG